MRIERLVLKNFRSHTETVLEFDRYNFLRGPNASGKSSIQMALEYLLTGRCVMTDAAGRGVESLIRAGEKELEVSATLAGGHKICRRRSGKSQIVEIDGRKTPVDVAEAFLAKQIGRPELLSAVLNVDRFVEMSAAEQVRLLAQAVPADRTALPADISEALRALNEPEPRSVGVAEMDFAYRHYRELLAEAAHTLDGLEQTAKPDTTELPPALEVESKLQELRQEKERLMGQAQNAEQCWQNAQPRSSLAPKQSEMVPSEEARAAGLQRELDELNTEHKIIGLWITAIEKANGCCPTCGQAIGQVTKTERVHALRDRREELEALMQGTREELLDCSGAACAESPQESSFLHALRSDVLEGRLAILTERIAKAERVLERIRQVQTTKEKWEAGEEEKLRLQSRVNYLQKLVSYFAPEGPATAASRNGIRSVVDNVNQYLGVFGYACNLSFDPYEINVRVDKTASFGLAVKQLSESERFRFGVAFQVALAMATGLRFVVIDRADALDVERRRMLTSLLVRDELDQAVILATGEAAPPALAPPEVRFLDLTKCVNDSEHAGKNGSTAGSA